MLYAVRGNKQLKISEADRQRYLNLGYDIAEDQGDALVVVQHAPSKTVPYAEYEKLQKENEALKAQLAQLTNGTDDGPIEKTGKRSGK